MNHCHCPSRYDRCHYRYCCCSCSNRHRSKCRREYGGDHGLDTDIEIVDESGIVNGIEIEIAIVIENENEIENESGAEFVVFGRKQMMKRTRSRRSRSRIQRLERCGDA